MGGGLIQLVANGDQDKYLTGNPQITFFREIYKRHTNFSTESIKQSILGNTNFGQKVRIDISKEGDLISDMYFEIQLPALDQKFPNPTDSPNDFVNWTQRVGNAIIKSVELKIGNIRIDKHLGLWLDIWNQLTIEPEKKDLYNKMVGDWNSNSKNIVYKEYSTKNNYNRWSNFHPTGEGSYPTNLIVPLNFWFCRNIGLALPIIALQYTNISLEVEINELKNLVISNRNIGTPYELGSTCIPSLDLSLFVTYVYLDRDERRKFAQSNHQYLIEQVQYLEPHLILEDTNYKKINLDFNHPVKSIHWVLQDIDYDKPPNSNKNIIGLETGTSSNFIDDNGITCENNIPLYYLLKSPVRGLEFRDTFSRAKIVLNGVDRFNLRNSSYFRTYQNFEHNLSSSDISGNNLGIYTYSFSLDPKKHQPSGTLNFSRLDDAHIYFEWPDTWGSNSLDISRVKWFKYKSINGFYKNDPTNNEYNRLAKDPIWNSIENGDLSVITNLNNFGDNFDLVNIKYGDNGINVFEDLGLDEIPTIEKLKTYLSSRNKNLKLSIFAVNYNILSLCDGLGALQFLN